MLILDWSDGGPLLAHESVDELSFAQYLDLILKHKDTILCGPWRYFFVPATSSKSLGYS